MPITFKKDALIQAAQDAIATHDAAEAEWRASADKYRAEQIADKDLLPGIKALRNELSAFLRKGRQPTRDDARAFRAAAGHDYLHDLYVNNVSDSDVERNVPKPSGWLYRNKADSYRGLIRMLEANTEDTITAAQLKLFGYSDLEMLFRRAAQTGGTTVTG